MDYFFIIILVVFLLLGLCLYIANRDEEKEKKYLENQTVIKSINPKDYILEKNIIPSANSISNFSTTNVTILFAGILDLIAFSNFICSFFYGLFLLSSTTDEFGRATPDHNPITEYLGIALIVQGIIISTFMVLFAEIAKNIDKIRRVLENRVLVQREMEKSPC